MDDASGTAAETTDAPEIAGAPPAPADAVTSDGDLIVLEDGAFVKDPIIAYAGPEGASMDGYKTNKAGNLLAKASEADLLASHGFHPLA
jgi:hypothetical protein